MVSEGLKEVLREAMLDVGVCRDRILERVERNFRRMRCGRMTGSVGHESGMRETEKKRWIESSPPREK
jgi:hypothetical protein